MTRKQSSEAARGPLSRVQYDRSPAGGVVVRGLHYPGGKFIPKADKADSKMKFDQYAQIAAERNGAAHRKFQRADGSFDADSLIADQAKFAKKTDRRAQIYDDSARAWDDPKRHGHHVEGGKEQSHRHADISDHEQAIADRMRERDTSEKTKEAKKRPPGTEWMSDKSINNLARTRRSQARVYDDPKLAGNTDRDFLKARSHDWEQWANEAEEYTGKKPAREAKKHPAERPSSNLSTNQVERHTGSRREQDQIGKRLVDQGNRLRQQVRDEQAPVDPAPNGEARYSDGRKRGQNGKYSRESLGLPPLRYAMQPRSQPPFLLGGLPHEHMLDQEELGGEQFHGAMQPTRLAPEHISRLIQAVLSDPDLAEQFRRAMEDADHLRPLADQLTDRDDVQGATGARRLLAGQIRRRGQDHAQDGGDRSWSHHGGMKDLSPDEVLDKYAGY